MEILELMRVASQSSVFDTAITTVVASLVTFAITGIVRRNNRNKSLVSKSDLDKGIIDAKNYTDDKLNEHEKNQVIEINNMKEQIKDTHNMVTFLYQAAITKSH